MMLKRDSSVVLAWPAKKQDVLEKARAIFSGFVCFRSSSPPRVLHLAVIAENFQKFPLDIASSISITTRRTSPALLLRECVNSTPVSRGERIFGMARSDRVGVHVVFPPPNKPPPPELAGRV